MRAYVDGNARSGAHVVAEWQARPRHRSCAAIFAEVEKRDTTTPVALFTQPSFQHLSPALERGFLHPMWPLLTHVIRSCFRLIFHRSTALNMLTTPCVSCGTKAHIISAHKLSATTHAMTWRAWQCDCKVRDHRWTGTLATACVHAPHAYSHPTRPTQPRPAAAIHPAPRSTTHIPA